ncbi:4Fe-4S dicluster domain-containing protein [Fundidesulfovibrio terrae]|uniref:4Fe-4S dicluster domain-containing protein n=1 Tax=Fundidesulfovibrio terrae TaxID=2922866 RepID=UPI001FAFE46A|nr:4Fe-4S dicluster domain-containing protein [Fundidesulfovibrio terrae]
METAKFLPESSLEAWLAELASSGELIVPRREGDAVVFGPYDPNVPLELSRDATAPPKSVVFPACEELLRYTYVKDAEDISKTGMSVEEVTPACGAVVFGARPCGARGFTVYDRVFDAEGMRDPYYAARRAATAFVTLACREAGSACFCHWVGSGPADPQGSDVLLTPVPGGYVAEAVTEKGAALLASPLMAPAGKHAGEAKAVRAKAMESLDTAQDVSPAREALLAAFDDMDFWNRMSAKCISCGACTYLCPTCYCFNITDEAQGNGGTRLRSWDNCMSFQFTLEASGHNPRPTKAHRLKNRVGHKFSYYPGIHGGVVACCGCGRCIRSCPAGVDIREIVLAAMERATAKPQE